ncbi:MAG: 2-oxo acid dehydrogenase subunit E2, partial [Deltaproteobacteria bacterium]|nr:2-oxo acid dehydrogenase subunit E2 [Deltaproteobacteria bacterium]
MYSFKLPDIGEGVVEAEVVAWKVAVGDRVELDQILVELMTDKANVEIPSPAAGTVTSLPFAEGELVPVGEVLIEIDD